MSADDSEGFHASRLDALFQRSRPEGRKWTNDEVAAELRKANPGIKVSGAYLSALRNGKRTHPSAELLASLAKFFGVSPAYFFNRDHAEQVSQQLEMLGEMRQAGVRAIALRAAGLPEESLRPIRAVLDEVRKLQGLPPVEE